RGRHASSPPRPSRRRRLPSAPGLTVRSARMPDFVHLTASDARRVPWKNGLGVTEELAIWPEGSAFEDAAFEWRISKASVPEPGPFSAFPGFDGVLVVLTGEGLRLDHGPAAPPAEVRELEPYAFSGDWPTSAQLLGGPVQDYNLIARRGTSATI